MGELQHKIKRKMKRTQRVRSKLFGTKEMPRFCVFRSSKHIYAQIIDDVKRVTIIGASSKDKEIKIKNGGNIEAAKQVGKIIAERALKKKIKDVVFDRGPYLYHGRIKALADSAREKGLNF